MQNVYVTGEIMDPLYDHSNYYICMRPNCMRIDGVNGIPQRNLPSTREQGNSQL